MSAPVDARAMPSGTVTFLFTDLEGSTRLWQDHPDAMADALARHDELVGGAIVAHGGHVVKTTGDGFHAAFDAAHDAIAAAVSAQRGVGAEAWAGTGPLRVRMGIHTGPADLRDGDYYGTAVNRAARLMSVAHGGQIVLSLATEELLPDGTVELVDLGEHALRDLSRPERVFQVAHPDLPREFPRLATLDAFGGNLPVQVTSFVGRDDDVARIDGLLDAAALVTLIGTGGVGKTRLAVQVAAETLPRFRDGAWFCELAPVDDAEGVAQVVATTLGCVQRPGLSLTESVIEYLKVRSLLLVLDNCEHLVDDAADLAEAVLRSCPDVQVIVTSREALDVAGERVVRVRSLDAPDRGSSRDALVHAAAVRLFTDRAIDAGAAVTWSDAQWSAVGEICRRVDGIPLAIELAAARVTAMSPADIAAHLDERFRLLTGKRRGRVERHQTLRGTVEWSYDLLAEGERSVFDRLGVFPGSFDAAATVAVAGGDTADGWTVIEALGSLVAKSMVVADDGHDGATRYSMLETLRQYARERLEDSGDADRCRRRHADHYAAWANGAVRGLGQPDAPRWLDRFRAEFDNVRAAVEWAIESDAPAVREVGLRILGSLAEFANVDGSLGLQGLAVLALPAAEAAAPELRIPVLTVAGYAAFNRGDLVDGRRLLDAAIAEGVILSSASPLEAWQLRTLVALVSGDVATALALADEVRVGVEVLDDDFFRASLLGGLACYMGILGRVEQSRRDAERAMAAARRCGSPVAMASALHGSAWALQREDPVGSLAAAEQCLDLNREFVVLRGSIAAVHALAGGLRARLGDEAGAFPHLHDAVLVGRDHGVRSQLASALDWSIGPLARRGDPAAAAILLGGLTDGSLAGVADFPGVEDARARVHARIEAALGAEDTTRLLAQGAAMTYDELVAYALEQLRSDGGTPAGASPGTR